MPPTTTHSSSFIRLSRLHPRKSYILWHITCTESLNLQAFSISYCTRLDRELGCLGIPGFDRNLLSGLALDETEPSRTSEFHFKFIINQAKELIMTECRLMEPDWKMLPILFRLHPQLQVVNAWDIPVWDLHEIGPRMQDVSIPSHSMTFTWGLTPRIKLLEHFKLDMQSLDVLRFGCGWSDTNPLIFHPDTL
ncbi:hypothetical protein PIIN_05167 [Serendipita indica DSM 11827]|uniref:Uncharacterized protein n=1 Tax=Serendipita indica (strain DSM 11827) TaxID=1109443 RepID=G4TIT5_SERID|nr:hypothetical protein PIIN_05167 [Serendipita indica DSM 11827]